MDATTKISGVWVASWQWLEIVQRGEELECEEYPYNPKEFDALIDQANRFGAEYDDFTGPIRLDSEESAIQVVTAVSGRHSRLRVGDLLITDGYGSDCVFLRRHTSGV